MYRPGTRFFILREELYTCWVLSMVSSCMVRPARSYTDIRIINTVSTALHDKIIGVLLARGFPLQEVAAAVALSFKVYPGYRQRGGYTYRGSGRSRGAQYIGDG